MLITRATAVASGPSPSGPLSPTAVAVVAASLLRLRLRLLLWRQPLLLLRLRPTARRFARVSVPAPHIVSTDQIASAETSTGASAAGASTRGTSGCRRRRCAAEATARRAGTGDGPPFGNPPASASTATFLGLDRSQALTAHVAKGLHGTAGDGRGREPLGAPRSRRSPRLSGRAASSRGGPRGLELAHPPRRINPGPLDCAARAGVPCRGHHVMSVRTPPPRQLQGVAA